MIFFHGIQDISLGPERLQKNAVFVLLRVGKKPPPSTVFFGSFFYEIGLVTWVVLGMCVESC